MKSLHKILMHQSYNIRVVCYAYNYLKRHQLIFQTLTIPHEFIYQYQPTFIDLRPQLVAYKLGDNPVRANPVCAYSPTTHSMLWGKFPISGLCCIHFILTSLSSPRQALKKVVKSMQQTSLSIVVQMLNIAYYDRNQLKTQNQIYLCKIPWQAYILLTNSRLS